MTEKTANEKKSELIQKLKEQKKKIEIMEDELYKEEKKYLILEKMLDDAILVWQK